MKDKLFIVGISIAILSAASLVVLALYVLYQISIGVMIAPQWATMWLFWAFSIGMIGIFISLLGLKLRK